MPCRFCSVKTFVVNFCRCQSVHDPWMAEQRANAVTREPELQSFWEKERIYERLSEENPGEKFVLHDGPPYANGDLHIGHALNKVKGMVS